MLSMQSVTPRTAPTIAFLGITVLETVVDVVIVACLLSSFEGGFVNSVLARNDQSVLPVYLGLFVLAHVFQLVLAVDALSAKNTIQIMGLLLFNTLFLVYSAIQIVEIKELIKGRVLSVLVWFIPGMIAATEIVYLSTFWAIYREFGWTIYKRIGADRSIKKMFAWYQVFICIVKFDCFFFIAFSLQLVFLVLQQNAAERWLTVAAVPISLLLLGVGYFSVRREHRLLFWCFLVGALAGAAYFVWKLFRIYEFRTTDYVLVYKSLTVFAAFCLAALVWTCTAALICFRHFGRGLKQAMARTSGTVDDKLENGRYMLESANNSRMSMD